MGVRAIGQKLLGDTGLSWAEPLGSSLRALFQLEGTSFLHHDLVEKIKQSLMKGWTLLGEQRKEYGQKEREQMRALTSQLPRLALPL